MEAEAMEVPVGEKRVAKTSPVWPVVGVRDVADWD